MHAQDRARKPFSIQAIYRVFTRLAPLLFLASSSLGCAASATAKARPAPGPAEDLLQLKDLTRIRHVMQAIPSPDGKHQAYLLRVPRVPLEDEDGPAYSELHIVSSEGESRPFVTGKVSVRNIAWSPDGKGVSFITKRKGDSHPALYWIALSGGEAARIFSHEAGIQGYHWHPEGKQIAFTGHGPEDKKKKGLKKKGFKAQIIEEDVKASRLWVADIQKSVHTSQRNKPEKPKARELPLEGSVSIPRWSPDGSKIAIAVAPTPLIDDHYMKRKIAILDAQSGKELLRIQVPGKLASFRWSPKGKFIALNAGADQYDSSPGRLLLADALTGKIKNLLPELLGDVKGLNWKGEDALNLVIDKGTRTHLATLSLKEGSKVEIAKEALPFVAWNYAFSADGKTAGAGGSQAHHAAEVYTLDLESGSATRITNHNPWLEKIRMGKQETIRYKAADGLEIEGVLIHPVTRKKKERVPLIVSVHGGPESHIKDGWLSWYGTPGQVFAGRGFAVFFPNYRGSTGRGLAYTKGDYGDPAGKEFDDIVNGVDYLASTGLVDVKRVGITGGSYGGYASAWGATFYTKRFAASVPFVGVTNLLSKSGTTEITNEMKLVHYGKHAWDDWEFFTKRSPIYHAEGSVTATLIMHGTADTRVDAGQSQELFRHLKIRGKAPVRLVLYPGEGHGNRKAASRLDYSIRILRWMEHYLKGDGGDPPPYEIDYDEVLGKDSKKKDAKKKESK